MSTEVTGREQRILDIIEDVRRCCLFLWQRTSRKLVIATNRRDLRLVVVRASDTPTYVQHGGADIGIAGRDVLAEHGGEGLYQPVDLGIAACRMIVAVRKGFGYAAAVRQGARLRVATKYINTAREHFAAKGVHVDLIRLYGSMELAPLLGLIAVLSAVAYIALLFGIVFLLVDGSNQFDVAGTAEDSLFGDELSDVRPAALAGVRALGDLVVIIAGAPPGIPGSTNALRIHRMGDAVNEVAPAYRRQPR